jgi:hypothetical protein
LLERLRAQQEKTSGGEVITPEQAKMLLDFPDLESVVGPVASRRATERHRIDPRQGTSRRSRR